MDRPKTYFGFLESIAGNEDAIEQEKNRLDLKIAELGERIRGQLTPTTVPGLLWCLALKEFVRFSSPVGNPVSGFAGHARYLKALCAAVRFDSVQPSDDPNVEELFGLCRVLWSAMFHRALIDDLKRVDINGADRRKNHFVAMTSLLEAVQGELRYVEQVQERVERLFAPFSTEIIEPALGISTADVISGFDTLRRVITRRITDSATLTRPALEIWKEWGRRSRSGASDEELHRFVVDHLHYEDIGKNISASIREMNSILLFCANDFCEVLGDRAEAFLDAFAFVPGEVNLDVRTPYDDDIVRRRPFAKIGVDTFVLVDVVYSSFSPPHRLLECFDTDRKLQRLNKKRDDALEDEAARLFNSVVNADTVLRSYYLHVGGQATIAERDLLLLKDNCVFVIESKARPLRPVKLRRDKLVRIATDVKHSIQEGYDQASAVIRLLKAANGPVPVFDSSGRQALELDASHISEFFPVVFLDSYYGLVATDLGPWLNVDPCVGYPWVVDRDTFESITLKVDSFEKFKAFLEWRRMLHGVVVNEDEAVFAGAFLTHGPFKIPDNTDLVQLEADYADIFEAEHFRRKGYDVKMPRENIGPPVLTSIERAGEEIRFRIDGEVREAINVHTGESREPNSGKKRSRTDGKTGRNDPCPCGSRLKFKKCCMRVR